MHVETVKFTLHFSYKKTDLLMLYKVKVDTEHFKAMLAQCKVFEC